LHVLWDFFHLDDLLLQHDHTINNIQEFDLEIHQKNSNEEYNTIAEMR
jgi:hypothetical protein